MLVLEMILGYGIPLGWDMPLEVEAALRFDIHLAGWLDRELTSEMEIALPSEWNVVLVYSDYLEGLRQAVFFGVA